MYIWRMCVRRTAILAALGGGLILAFVGARVCSTGLIWVGGICKAGVMSAYTFVAG